MSSDAARLMPHDSQIDSNAHYRHEPPAPAADGCELFGGNVAPHGTRIKIEHGGGTCYFNTALVCHDFTSLRCELPPRDADRRADVTDSPASAAGVKLLKDATATAGD